MKLCYSHSFTPRIKFASYCVFAILGLGNWVFPIFAKSQSDANLILSREATVKDTSTTVRVGAKAHQILRALAEESDCSMAEMLDTLVKEEATRRFFARMEEAHKRVMACPVASAERQEEIKQWG